MVTRHIPQEEILGLIAIAEDHGITSNVLVQALVEWASPITDSEIYDYAVQYLAPEMLEQGYGVADYESAREVLEEARQRYAPDRADAAD